MSQQVHDIKSFHDISMSALPKQSWLFVAKVKCPMIKLSGKCSRNSKWLLKRSKKSKSFILKVCKIDNYHDGESIWRKFGEIKRFVFNDITKLYMKNLPGGQLS